MKFYINALLLIVPAFTFAQQPDQNYKTATIYKAATVDGNVADSSKTVSVSYYDGLGRPVQHIAVAQSPTGKSIVTPVAYDLYGRQSRDYLPFQGDNGSAAFDPTAEDKAFTFYSGYREGTSNPYSQKFFEDSPLNKVLKQAAPGDAWAGNPSSDNDHAIKFDYLFNDDDEVRQFKATTSWDGLAKIYTPQFSDLGHYAENSLTKTVTKDENWTSGKANTTEEFKDKNGRTVLKRVYGTSFVNGSGTFTEHDTYYIYDEYGNLTYVIPPLASQDGAIMPNLLDDLCYQYRYDRRNRLVEKKLPGKNWDYIIYDRLDRVAMTGPVMNPFGQAGQGWLFTKYEPLGRVAYTGYYEYDADATARHSLQATYDSAGNFYETRTTQVSVGGISISYTNKIFPRNVIHTLTVDYYDNYTYYGVPTVPTVVESQSLAASVVGLTTGSWLRAISTSSSTAGEMTAIFYDTKYRPVRMHKINYLGGHTIVDSKLKFSGLETYKITKHKRADAGSLITIKEKFTYSEQDRLVLHTHQINGGFEELMSQNEYDALGQLISKNVGNEPMLPIQEVDYNYNVRGWLTEINRQNENVYSPVPDLFKFKISYNSVDDNIGGLVKPLFNGNISETSWKTNSDGVTRKYGYRYDEMNRLLDAYYHKPNGSGNISNSYNESLTYDKNGNINSIVRNGELDSEIEVIEIDRLQYGYHPSKKNQLMLVSDATNHPGGFNNKNANGQDYYYDDFGNLIFDKNKGIAEILYNHLNLPTSINFGNGRKIKYLYAADGSKLKKTIEESTGDVMSVTEYLDGFQYSGSLLDFFPTSEGYVKYTTDIGSGSSGSYNYVYQYRDHLGNVRLNYGLNPTTGQVEIMEESHYYPFGLKHLAYNSTIKAFFYGKYGNYYTGIVDVQEAQTNSYKYKYNGKEFQDELGLNLYDYGWRNYDPAIGRWMNIDPLAEQYRRWSPYNYCIDNPMRFVDPDGMGVDDVVVPQKYQKQFDSALTGVFGKESSNFKYDSNGKLSFSGDTKNFNSDQKAVYKGLEKLMKSKDVTNVIYEPQYTVNDKKGNPVVIDATKSGGESTLTIADNPNVAENYVVVDPKMAKSFGVLEVTSNYYSSKGTLPSPTDPPNFKPTTVQVSPESITFHGIGHVVNAGKSQEKVLDYDNKARNQMGLPKRNPDETHNKTVK